MKADIMDGDLIRYLPTMVELIYQTMIYNIKTKKCLLILHRFLKAGI